MVCGKKKKNRLLNRTLKCIKKCGFHRFTVGKKLILDFIRDLGRDFCEVFKFPLEMAQAHWGIDASSWEKKNISPASGAQQHRSTQLPKPKAKSPSDCLRITSVTVVTALLL